MIFYGVFEAYKPTLKKTLFKLKGSSLSPCGLTPLHFTKILVKLTFFSSPLEGERANDCNGSCTSGAVRGQKPTATTGLRLSQKLKQKKFHKWRFFDFNFNPQIYKFFKQKFMIF